MRDLGAFANPSNPVDFMSFTVGDAEREVKEATQAKTRMTGQERNRGQNDEESGSTTEEMMSLPTASTNKVSPSGPGGFDFSLPVAPATASASAGTSRSNSMGHSNGSAHSSRNGSHSNSNSSRRRSAAPTMIPNFPSSMQPRESPFSPSPSESPAAASANHADLFQSPKATPPQQPQPSLGRLPAPSFSNMNAPGPSGMQSPWHILAASSGAPTPSIDGPGRNSPHLGSPFEKLNLGGSWSGANLDQGPASAERRASLEPPSFFLNGGFTSPGKPHIGGGSHSNGFSFGGAIAGGAGGGVKSPLAKSDEDMQIDPPESSSTSKKPPLPPTLAMRRASLPKNHVNIHGGPIAKSSSPLAASPSPGSSSKPQPLAANQLAPLVAKSTTLILDLRPPSSFQESHLPDSHSLPVPSTLLRRPAFNIQKLAQMLSAPSMEAVMKWRDKSDIVLVDQDSTSVPDGSVLDGLAAKFNREGFAGRVWFIKGGQRSVQLTASSLLAGSGAGGDCAEETSAPSNGGLMAGGMSRLAFQQGSTGGGPSSPTVNMRSPAAETPGLALRLKPFDKTISPTKGIGHARHPSFRGEDAASMQGHRLQPANPFFDNIRQNLELSHGGITERIPLKLPDYVARRASEMPDFLGDLITKPEKDVADQLANEFYELELGEQRRLQSVMDWHTQDSGAALDRRVDGQPSQQDKDKVEVDRLAAWGAARAAGQVRSPEQSDNDHYFPFSITAGVERGTKNRYKNIWPYDFSRVRLGAPADDSDYINASFVQPRGTSRRYIATQGPLDATFCDFWTLVWEQDVRVIVMITKQFEGGSVKCGHYWEEKQYGPVKLKIVSQIGGEDHGATGSATGFDFGMAAATPQERDEKPESHIKRVFSISHVDHPEAAPRQIVQIQCVSWPDFNVPESADVLLSLIREVDATFGQLREGMNTRDRQDEPPVLVHCSAGVGRTGSFIVVDAILDGLRSEHRLPSLSSALPTAPSGGQSNVSRPSSSRASSGEKIAALAQPTANRLQHLGNVVPEMEESTARATDQQYQGVNFTQHRRGHAPTASVSSFGDEGDWNRRPSLASVFTSDEHLSMPQHTHDKQTDRMTDIERSMGMPRPITLSGTRHRSPTPLSQMDNPVLEVLEGMRVQRMSLVQSLRQYVFVYRAIITGFVQMLDEDRSRETSNNSKSSFSTANTGSTAITIPHTSSSEDDMHAKRRASPTELVPDQVDPHRTAGDEDFFAGGEGSSGVNLVKRPSFKKMRSSAVEGISLATKHQGKQDRTATSTTSGSSPKKAGGAGGNA